MDYVQLEPGWLEKQIAATKEEVSQWPAWFRKGRHYAVVYTWQDGREEVRYTRPVTDVSLAKEVRDKVRHARSNGFKSPYSIRRIP